MVVSAALRQFTVDDLDAFPADGNPGGPKDIPHDAELAWRSPGGRELRLDVAALFLRVPAGE